MKFEEQTAPELAVPLPPKRGVLSDNPVSPEHKRMTAMFDGEYKYPATEHYLNEILARLAATGEPGSVPYRVTILNSPIVNAFALPPANLYVTRGLLALANDASEAAAVMAHEIAHITARHALQREEQEKRAEVISKAASVVQSKDKGKEVEASAQRTIASFSRQQELDADQIGIKVIARAGYDPYGASRFLIALDRSSAIRASLLGQNSGNETDLLATHPSTPERIAQAINAARQIGAPGIGVTERNSYLAAINGMMFGDDPAEGAIRGRIFIHPRLGFAFRAPEGFVLENSSQAVLGVAAGGNEVLRLDSVKLASNVTLESYLETGWIDGLIANSVVSVQVNGMPALLANAHAGEWSFLIAVIRFDENEVHRLIFATRTLTDEAVGRYRESIDSFHHTTAGEINAVHPLQLAIVIAKPEDTADTLALKMAMPEHALDFFLLINGLDQGAQLQKGEHYKIVIE